MTVVDPVVPWQKLKVGGGGFVRGLDIAPDGTMVGRTDTNGAYLVERTSAGRSSSPPRACPPPVAADPAALGEGVFEIQIADSNTQIFYMIFNGYMFKSTNQGATWTQTSFDGSPRSPPTRTTTTARSARGWPSIPTIPTSSMPDPKARGCS